MVRDQVVGGRAGLGGACAKALRQDLGMLLKQRKIQGGPNKTGRALRIPLRCLVFPESQNPLKISCGDVTRLLGSQLPSPWYLEAFGAFLQHHPNRCHGQR